MNIALIAHDKKKELMIQFCTAYKSILEHHSLCGTATTAKLVSEATGLEIHAFLSGAQGGVQQIGARIAYNEIDMMLFFRDPLSKRPHEPDVSSVLTAEVLVLGLSRGDMGWRDILKTDGSSENLI